MVSQECELSCERVPSALTDTDFPIDAITIPANPALSLPPQPKL